MSAIEKIEKTVLGLPVKERVFLIESLLCSLPPLPKEMSEADELAEAERRDREIENGKVQPLDDAEFWSRVESRRKR